MLGKILKFAGWLLGFLLLFTALFLLYASITYFNPGEKVVLWQSDKPDTIPSGSTMAILSWNIGYAGLGSNMDFFMDGGEKMRDTREQTLQNLTAIEKTLGGEKINDFILLQEVDINSHRSYSINELEEISKTIGYQNFLGINYRVNFVPVPLKNPMGRVQSGLVTFSKFNPRESVRYAFPGAFSWPNRLFNLRRCMVVNRYPMSNGKDFILVNTHNSAYDDGTLKQQEMDFLRKFLLDEYDKGNYVVVGGDWNQLPPGAQHVKTDPGSNSSYFKLTGIDSSFMPKGWSWVFDPASPTNRYLNESYTPGHSYTCILDFFLVSPNVNVLRYQTMNMDFKNSDHNPVTLQFTLKGNP